MALTGSLYANQCFSSASFAADSYFSSQRSELLKDSYTYFEKVSGVWKLTNYAISGQGVYTLKYQVNAVTPTFATCDPTASYFDGMALGWGVVGAMALVSSVLFLKKALYR